MNEFITSLNKLCTLFEPYIQAHAAEREEQQRKRFLMLHYFMLYIIILHFALQINLMNVFVQKFKFAKSSCVSFITIKLRI